MITDKVIAVIYNLLGSLADALPETGSAPGWLSSGGMLSYIDFVIPIGAFTGIVAFMILAFGVLYVFRVIRLFTPGG